MKPLILFLLSPLIFLLTSHSDSTYDAFLQCLILKNPDPSDKITSIVYSLTNSSYANVLNSYIRNLRFMSSTTPKPAIIVTPLSEAQVSAAIICGQSINIQIKIRSGGHDFEGISYVSHDPSFIILDMFNLRSVSINLEQQTAWVESGATLGELYYYISQKSKILGFPAGVCPTVGVGGHVTGGGYGNMLRKYGLASDNIVDAKIVTFDGKILDRSTMGEDLFWAIRGGGGSSFGVILSYKVNLVQIPEIVTYFRVKRELAENATDLVYKWQSVAYSTDKDLFMRLLLQPVNSVLQKGEKTIRATVVALFLGDSSRLLSLLNKEFQELNLQKSDCQEMSWIESVIVWSNFDVNSSPQVLLNRTSSSSFLKRKSDYVQQPLSREDLDLLWKKMLELGKVGLVFNPYGGKMAEISASQTSFPHRAGNLWKIQYSVNWEEDGEEAEKLYLDKIRSLHEFMTPYVSKYPRRAFLNYRDLDIGLMNSSDVRVGFRQASEYGQKYFGTNFDRLVDVKTKFDPWNYFHNEQSIPVLPPQKNSGPNTSSLPHSFLFFFLFLFPLFPKSI